MPIGEGWELPVESAPWSQFHWFRVSPRSALVVVLLSEEVVWYTGHFLEGRMNPCQGKGCELCKTGIGGQVRYVLPVAEVSTRRVGLLEVSRGIGQLVRSWIARHEGLRGMVLELSKHSLSKQSRTDVAYIDRPVPPWYLDLEVPDVRKALFLTWRKAGFEIPPGLSE